MNRVRQMIVVSVSSLMIAGVAAAVPISFQLDNVTAVGAAFPASQVYSPGFSIMGSGDIDFGLGTGTLFLSDYSITIDVSLDSILDARLDIANWSQTITAIDGSGNITSTGGGTTVCTNLGGLGALVCPSVSPTVAGWPPVDGATLPSSAVIDTGTQTITVVDNSNSLAGTITQYYSYTILPIVPEPGAAVLVGGSLLACGLIRRRQIH